MNKRCRVCDKSRLNMNKIVKKFLLIGDKFMPQFHLGKPRFT